MKVHHLNCGTMNPPGTASVVCHVLLVETDSGLVLVDTGFGSHDCADPAGRVGPLRHLLRPVLSHEETAAHQVEQLGFRCDDVRHSVVTHSTWTTSAVCPTSRTPKSPSPRPRRSARSPPRRGSRRRATEAPNGHTSPKSLNTTREGRSGEASPRPRNLTRSRPGSC